MTAKQAVEGIISVLGSRCGFNSWWSNLDTDSQVEIKTVLVCLLGEGVDRVPPLLVPDQPEDVTIMVNGRDCKVPYQKEISYEQVILLANYPHTDLSSQLSVNLRNVVYSFHGKLLPGQKVRLMSGTVFTVTDDRCIVNPSA